jgi:hypothetical protein
LQAVIDGGDRLHAIAGVEQDRAQFFVIERSHLKHQ